MADPHIIDTKQIERIEQELRMAGMSKLALRKFTTKYLPRIIHSDEHIEAAVQGRHKESEGAFGFIEGMLVATSKRVIFINHQPGYTTMDEIGYDKVSGVNISKAGFYASLTLFTKIANYTLSFASPKTAQKFTESIEEHLMGITTQALPAPPPEYKVQLSPEATSFLASHELGVLSSIERTGSVTGAAVYYTMYGGYPYFTTKTGTRKSANIMGDQHVALTVVDEQKLQTAQLQGIVEVETDNLTKIEIANKLVRVRHYEKGMSLPPVMRLAGEFIIFRIRPTKFNFTDYNK